ncbi:transcriptional regulator [Candidatus Thorarchaeota archaeon]|nr:MAG: transcriptional regulator [Candidatus Thorarchaeota archaeon]
MVKILTKARAQLTEEVVTQLDEAGFSLSSQCDVRPSCFDLVARKGDRLLLVKVLANIDALTKDDAEALQLVAQFFSATPLIVGQKTRKGSLDSGVVYKRHGVSSVAPHSFQTLVTEDKMPKQFAQRGGRLVAIDGTKLREARLQHKMTTGDLAECVQVSARAILAYEKDEMDISIDTAERLEKFLETDLMIPIDILQETREITASKPNTPTDALEIRVNEFFARLGMRVLWTDRAPFHVAAKEEGPPLISGVGSIKSWSLKKRTEILKSVSQVSESDAVIFVEEGISEESVSDIPVIRQLELDSIDKPRELKKIITERSGE